MARETEDQMLDQVGDPSQTAPRMQRVRGRAAVGFDQRRGATRLSDLAQAGSGKVMLPAGTEITEAVFLNTAGGLTGGDRLDVSVKVGAGARVVATTQTAERAYASAGGPPGRVDVRLDVGDGATLDWLPQETILFEQSDLERHTRADLASDARLLLCESLVLGRAAMGETAARVRLFDRREVRRAGAPIWIDPVALRPGAHPEDPAGLCGFRAFATLALIAPGAEDAAAALRGALSGQEAEFGVSGWDGRTLLRIRATDGWPMRRALVAALTQLRGRALPRVWQV